VRLQLSRRRGFNLHAISQATNGLPVVSVSRPSRWSNPFVIGIDGDRATVVQLYRDYLASPQRAGLVEAIRADLKGKNLACWCPPGEPCHSDVLLELANRHG
jgi:hypothetical protein